MKWTDGARNMKFLWIVDNKHSYKCLQINDYDDDDGEKLLYSRRWKVLPKSKTTTTTTCNVFAIASNKEFLTSMDDLCMRPTQ